jgi:hypothetical protein
LRDSGEFWGSSGDSGRRLQKSQKKIDFNSVNKVYYNISLQQKEAVMAVAEAKTYEDYLQEVSGISKEQLKEMTADWRLPNRDTPLDMKRLAEPSDEDIQYFGSI